MGTVGVDRLHLLVLPWTCFVADLLWLHNQAGALSGVGLIFTESSVFLLSSRPRICQAQIIPA